MKQRLTRLLSIELNNFKNVNNGFIEMPSLTAKQYDSQNSEILGIYGQNGSGKTAVIDALQFLKEILLGNPLPQNAHNYINVLNEKSSLSFEFYISNNNFESIVNYEFTISKKDENAAFISSEAIKSSISLSTRSTPPFGNDTTPFELMLFPFGAAALPKPFHVMTSTSIVALPLLSKIFLT